MRNFKAKNTQIKKSLNGELWYFGFGSFAMKVESFKKSRGDSNTLSLLGLVLDTDATSCK